MIEFIVDVMRVILFYGKCVQCILRIHYQVRVQGRVGFQMFRDVTVLILFVDPIQVYIITKVNR